MTKALSLLLALCLTATNIFGCATPAVHDYYLARDRVKEAGFRLGASHSVEWRLRGGGAQRKGSFELSASDPLCAEQKVFLRSKVLQELNREDWAWVSMSGGYPDRSTPKLPGAPCETALALDAFGPDMGPYLSITRGGSVLGSLEARPARRTAAIFLYLPAVIADTLIVCSGVILIGYLSGDHSHTWTPFRLAHPGVDAIPR